MGTFLAVESRTSTLALPARVPLVDNLQQGKKRERATCQTSRHPRRRDGGGGREIGKKEKKVCGASVPTITVCLAQTILAALFVKYRACLRAGQQRALDSIGGSWAHAQENAILRTGQHKQELTK